MNEKKRRFNGFDVAVVVTLLLIGGLAWLFLTDRAPAEEHAFIGDEVVYLVEVGHLQDWQVAQIQVGDRLQEGVRHNPIGEVIHIEVRPTEIHVTDHEARTVTI